MPSARRSLAGLRTRSAGTLATGVLAQGESLKAVWKHLHDGLVALAAMSASDGTTLPENGLTQRLINELERRPDYRPYYFQKEEMEDESHGQSPRADIAVRARDDGRFIMNGVPCAGTERFLVIEAKRLPTPGHGRDREYLCGSKGGVERFKRGAHASTAKAIAIIGYIQGNDPEHWRTTINQWVDELIRLPSQDLRWDELDKLVEDEIHPGIRVLGSQTTRVTDNKRLAIRHLWVELNRPSETPQKRRAPQTRKPKK